MSAECELAEPSIRGDSQRHTNGREAPSHLDIRLRGMFISLGMTEGRIEAPAYSHPERRSLVRLLVLVVGFAFVQSRRFKLSSGVLHKKATTAKCGRRFGFWYEYFYGA